LCAQQDRGESRKSLQDLPENEVGTATGEADATTGV
jgi:hypothetical protein